MLPLGLFQRPRVHRRPARGVRGLGLDVRAVPVPDAVPAELPRATRRSMPGLRYLPITVASFIVAPMAGMALARIQARYLMAGGLALTGVGLAADGRPAPGLRLDRAARRIRGQRSRRGAAEPGDRRRRAQRRPEGAKRHGRRDQRHVPPGRHRRRHRRLGSDLPRRRSVEDAGGRRRSGQRRAGARAGRGSLLRTARPGSERGPAWVAGDRPQRGPAGLPARPERDPDPGRARSRSPAPYWPSGWFASATSSASRSPRPPPKPPSRHTLRPRRPELRRSRRRRRSPAGGAAVRRPR